MTLNLSIDIALPYSEPLKVFACKYASLYSHKGVVHKLRLQDEVGSLKIFTFCQLSYHTKCQNMGLGGRKKPKSCPRSL